MSDSRRLSDKIFLAFNDACDQQRLDVAELLLQALELSQVAARHGSGNERRQGSDSMETAQEQIRLLRAHSSGAVH
jgi:hypothetical protein